MSLHLQDAQEQPSDEPGDECDRALDEDAHEKDRAIEQERQRPAVLKLFEVLLRDEARHGDGREWPQRWACTAFRQGGAHDREHREDEGDLRGMDEVPVYFRAGSSGNRIRELVAAENAQQRDGHDNEPGSLRLRHLPIMPVMSVCIDALRRLFGRAIDLPGGRVLYPCAP